MKTIIKHTQNEFRGQLNSKVKALIIAGLCLIFATTSYAAHTVKPLSGKALKKIEEKYDKETRKMFSGKNSDKNVLALKRLIAEDIDPDLAILAIKKYNEAESYRSGSKQKREAFQEIEDLFAKSKIDSKKGRDIMIGAGGAVRARKDKKVQTTYQKANKPSCSNKRTSMKKAPKIKYQDPDRLAESVLLKELNGEVEAGGFRVAEVL